MKVNQLNFIDAYARTGNATKSAQEAGYSEKNAKKQGWRLANDPAIKKLVEEKRLAIQAERNSSLFNRVNQLKNKDAWLAEIVKVFDDIQNPESPQRLKALEIVGRSCNHLSEHEARNLFVVDNRTLNHVEIVDRARQIAEKLKLSGPSSDNIPTIDATDSHNPLTHNDLSSNETT